MEDKTALRLRIRRETAEFDGGYILSSDRGIMENVLALPEFAAAGCLFGYLSVGRECGTRKIIGAAVALGKAVALPRTLGRGLMYFGEYSGRLEDGRYGIPEPPEDAARREAQEGDIVIVPALCCDAQGYRLGQGGGYYDRWLPGCRARSVCLCRERLLQENIPREWNDFPVDIVVTEVRTLRVGKPK